MLNSAGPMFHDVPRINMPTDVSLFCEATIEGLAEQLRISEADRAARLECIEAGAAIQRTLSADLDALAFELEHVIAERDSGDPSRRGRRAKADLYQTEYPLAVFPPPIGSAFS